MISHAGCELIARVVHETNRAYCEGLGDYSHVGWDDAPDWQKDSAIMGVQAAVAGDYTPREMHELWRTNKMVSGWVYGTTKDPVSKTHPCLVPYDELPPDQRLKDYLFIAIVSAFKFAAADRLLTTEAETT